MIKVIDGASSYGGKLFLIKLLIFMLTQVKMNLLMTHIPTFSFINTVFEGNEKMFN